ncbi:MULTISPECIES: N-acetylglucosamine-6-phosphate deacetylase [unclassified Arthrobacter]|uniref:N-acetylglucosamine-6-phosphate deacetylase n=1 Tax=unclassified Arthrobacter TaxID=235627 RepID=UPI001D150B6A|nr:MULTISPECIES: amidohydrolase family protein [unclassified Arthrobacter]MCC3290581.1 amidohydrolase family protein [Arthrobacter sp. zg-Y1110]MCC3299907.1 amidohydrolase family protein [Arthrobacter sp. zg-Y895]UWX84058.1 amidohydrolase family protein [Arthrobacter sp. zg-Y1110]
MNPTARSRDRGYLRGSLLTPDELVPDGALAFVGDRITYAGPASGFDGAGWPEPAHLPAGSLILPGLVDLHCHGAAGSDFTTSDAAGIRRAASFLHSAGTTTLLASMVTASRQDMLAAAARLGALAREGLIAGIHAEGPFLSPERCGAQDPKFLIPPDPGFVDELLAAADSELVTMTYAPELPGADDLVDRLVLHGVTPSLGHTAAADPVAAESLESARDEMEEAGFGGYAPRPTVTHLFNGMDPLHHRSPGAVAASLRAARSGAAVVELIADGAHLDPALVRTVFELAGGANVALVSDSMAATGLGDGTYRLGPAGVVVGNGTARLPDGTLAGGTATLLQCVRTAVAAGVPLAEAVGAATAVPADVLRLADEVGALRRGLRADALVVSPDLELHAVLRCGTWLPR